MTTINYIGHSAFFIKNKETAFVIDPFITQNPKAKISFDVKEIKNIFVTHGHSDHLGDSINLSKQTSAPIVAIFELANFCSQKGANSIGVGLGGNVLFPWGSVKFLPAFHSSSIPDGNYAGNAAGILFNLNGIKIYHAGDTALSTEMKILGDFYKPDIAFLPIGSHFTMGIEDAAVAAEWIGAKKIVPIHYNTFDAISADVQKFKTLISNKNKECIILSAGESIDV